jgi:hydroxymethylglutaryl-CoA synthase
MSAAALKAYHGLQKHQMLADQFTACCGEDEDSASMALTALHCLMHRLGVRPIEIGLLHNSTSLLDRSKSMKTELMALLDSSGSADVEGIDHYGACARGLSALLGCVDWAQSESWDGRWAMCVCSNDPSATTGQPLSSASAAAILVGRGTPLQVASEEANHLEHLPCVRGLQKTSLLDVRRSCTPFRLRATSMSVSSDERLFPEKNGQGSHPVSIQQ